MNPYYEDETLTLLSGDSVEQLRTLPDGSVNCVVTSPPYYGLRDYGGRADQIGLEATFGEYISRLVAVFREVRRVLESDGTLWLNLGDSYVYPPGSGGRQGKGQREGREFTAEGIKGTRELAAKNLMGIPWRVAFALQEDGWVLRNAIVWNKPNAMPESVTDRLSNRHELLFLFASSGRYWFDLDAIREPHQATADRVLKPAERGSQAWSANAAVGKPQQASGTVGVGRHVRGRNPGDVWAIPTRPLPEAHFAAFPVDLPRRCILAGCPKGGTVLDPFSGAGTTAMAAQQLGRKAIGIDINPEYHDIALRRMSDAPLPFEDGAA